MPSTCSPETLPAARPFFFFVHIYPTSCTFPPFLSIWCSAAHGVLSTFLIIPLNQLSMDETQGPLVIQQGRAQHFFFLSDPESTLYISAGGFLSQFFCMAMA